MKACKASLEGQSAGGLSSFLGMTKRFLGLGGSSQPSGIGLGALVTMRNFQHIGAAQKKYEKTTFSKTSQNRSEAQGNTTTINVVTNRSANFINVS